jgi:O-antigen/teichoic acid export membrane protein
LLYGPSFDALVPAFNVLLVGVFVLSLASPIANYFTLKLGRPQVALWLSLLSAVVCISTTVVVIGRLGMVGAAIGSSAGYVAGQAMALWYFLKISRVGARALLVPTADDFAVYRGFASRVLRDGRRLLRPAP